jgi:hypothetical protein
MQLVSRWTVVLLALLALCSPAAAQIQQGGRPASLRHALGGRVATLALPRVDGASLLLEDELAGRGGPERFAFVHEVDVGLEEAGTWQTLPDGSRVWRLRVTSPGARSLLIAFRRFQLPAGAELFVHDDDGSTVLGAFTSLNHLPDGRFAIQPIAGDAVTLEYDEPAGVAFPGELRLAAVLHDYRGVVSKGGSVGTSGACNVDVACPAGAGWEEESRSVGLVMNLNGTLCSGFLLNNTLEDATPFFLTAQHCGDLSLAMFTFNWKRSTCGSGSPTAMNDTITGSTQLVQDLGLDLQLVRLSSQPPPSYGVYFAGWDRSGTRPTSTVGIHHPLGDVMKIAVDNNQPNTPNTSWRVVRWDVGVTEQGSSGSPLFDPNQRAIGQLRNGAATCVDPVDDFYGRFDAEWDVLGPFLDPFNSGALTVDGFDPALAPTPSFSITGLSPSQVDVLEPGLARTVFIIGTGIDSSVRLDLDGVPIPLGNYGWFTNSSVTLDMPQICVGMHTITATKGLSSFDVGVQVVAADRPIHQAGSGDPGNPVNSALGIQVTNADTIGHTNISLWSTSNVPSVHPLGTLGLGNQFTMLNRINLVTIPVCGYNTMRVNVPASLQLMTVYSQSFCAQCQIPTTPSTIEISNLQSVFVAF